MLVIQNTEKIIIILQFLTFSASCVKIYIVEIHRFTVEFFSFVDGCMVKKDGCLVIPLGRNGGMCIVLDGKYSRMEAIHITLSEIAAICTILGFAYAIIKEIIAHKKKK